VRLAGQVVAGRCGQLDGDLIGLTEADVWNAVDLMTPPALRAGSDLEEFLGALATGAEVDGWDPRADRVNLLTLHASKGLEFPVVFLVGCEDGLLPLRPFAGAPQSQDDVAEERRLFFVGLTRAQDRLFVSHSRNRFRHGAERDMAPSPFLSAIDAGLLEQRGPTAPRRPKDRQLRLI
jgi:superfamily I DNA/RNA helicase